MYFVSALEAKLTTRMDPLQYQVRNQTKVKYDIFHSNSISILCSISFLLSISDVLKYFSPDLTGFSMHNGKADEYTAARFNQAVPGSIAR